MPTQAYFEVDGEGDFYACVSPTSPGESPTTAPEKWAKLEIPAILERFLVEQALCFLMMGEGQLDKRMAMQARVDALRDDLVFQYNDRGDLSTPDVRTR